MVLLKARDLGKSKFLTFHGLSNVGLCICSCSSSGLGFTMNFNCEICTWSTTGKLTLCFVSYFNNMELQVHVTEVSLWNRSFPNTSCEAKILMLYLVVGGAFFVFLFLFYR